MTFAQSRKSFSCWNCEYFVHENAEESYSGYCRRKAPKALDLYGPGSFVLTTKGDLLTRNDEELIRLPVGPDDSVLRADSGFPGGLVWDYQENWNLSLDQPGEISTGSVFPQIGATFTSPATMPPGTYIVHCCYCWAMNGTTDAFKAYLSSLAYPGTEIAFTQAKSLTGSSNDYQSASGHYLNNFPGGSTSFNLLYGLAGGSTDNAYVKNIRITMILLAQSGPAPIP